MSSHTVSKLLVAAIIFTAVTGGAMAGDTMRLQQVREGRFVYFADLDTISREGSGARLRSLQMSDEPMLIDGKAYIGGYSNWQFDCEARTGRQHEDDECRTPCPGHRAHSGPTDRSHSRLDCT